MIQMQEADVFPALVMKGSPIPWTWFHRPGCPQGQPNLRSRHSSKPSVDLSTASFWQWMQICENHIPERQNHGFSGFPFLQIYR